jgi:hypothetical protein
MQGLNIYRNVPFGAIKRFILGKVQELNEVQLARVYELISGNTCLEKGEKGINISVNEQAQHPCDPRFGPPFPPNPKKHPDDSK